MAVLFLALALVEAQAGLGARDLLQLPAPTPRAPAYGEEAKVGVVFLIQAPIIL
jgi:hypothetical protein